jgi:SAM-dependent methyltransferase
VGSARLRLVPGWPRRGPFFVGGTARGFRFAGGDWLGGIEELRAFLLEAERVDKAASCASCVTTRACKRAISWPWAAMVAAWEATSVSRSAMRASGSSNEGGTAAEGSTRLLDHMGVRPSHVRPVAILRRPREELPRFEPAACPICGRSARFWREAPDRHYGNRGVWKVYRCEACGHMHQNPIPDEKNVLGYYPASYYAYQPPNIDLMPRALIHMGVRLTMHYLKRCRGYRHLPCRGNPLLAAMGFLRHRRPLHCGLPRYKEGGVLLDYGSGAGHYVAFARFIGWETEGIEINAAAAQVGRNAGLSILTGSIETLESYTGRYDCIVSSHCVEHVTDVRRLFHAFFRALKPGGLLAIDVPNAAAAAIERYREFAFYFTMPVHIHGFSPDSIRRLAEQTGFVNLTVATYSWWPTHAKAALLLMRSRRSVIDSPAFAEPRGWEGLVARMAALPTYLRSRVDLRGDCLVMMCLKPPCEPRLLNSGGGPSGILTQCDAPLECSSRLQALRVDKGGVHASASHHERNHPAIA